MNTLVMGVSWILIAITWLLIGITLMKNNSHHPPRPKDNPNISRMKKMLQREHPEINVNELTDIVTDERFALQIGYKGTYMVIQPNKEVELSDEVLRVWTSNLVKKLKEKNK